MEEEALAARLVAAGLAARPALPGVYRFRDGAGGLVYLGSSRDLGRRVRSYFAPGHAAASKTRQSRASPRVSSGAPAARSWKHSSPRGAAAIDVGRLGREAAWALAVARAAPGPLFSSTARRARV